MQQQHAPTRYIPLAQIVCEWTLRELDASGKLGQGRVVGTGVIGKPPKAVVLQDPSLGKGKLLLLLLVQ